MTDTGAPSASLWDDVDGDLEGEPFNTWPTREEVEKYAWIHEQTIEYLRRQREAPRRSY